eukprot:m.494591 g.494591  ORF g.494591 m.494591 type:complete len:625 (-) comp57290_c0_seq1:1814-3688(-)
MSRRSLEETIEACTSASSTSEDWGAIMEVCDLVSADSRNAGLALQAIFKRFTLMNAAVDMLSLTLLEACVKNCGKPFHRELCARYTTNELKRIVTAKETAARVSTKLKSLMQQWEREFASDSSLDGMAVALRSLRDEQSRASATEDLQRKEDEDFRRAVEESLKASSSSSSSSRQSQPSQAPRDVPQSSKTKKAKALYDFEAKEANELPFRAGAIVTVTDASDSHWWKGETPDGNQGYFPANFVTYNLSTPIPAAAAASARQGTPATRATSVAATVVPTTPTQAAPPAQVNEAYLDTLLAVLQQAAPGQDLANMRVNTAPPMTVAQLEIACANMRAPIAEKIESHSQRLDHLGSLSDRFSKAREQYQMLMAQPRAAAGHPVATTPLVGVPQFVTPNTTATLTPQGTLQYVQTSRPGVQQATMPRFGIAQAGLPQATQQSIMPGQAQQVPNYVQFPAASAGGQSYAPQFAGPSSNIAQPHHPHQHQPAMPLQQAPQQPMPLQQPQQPLQQLHQPPQQASLHQLHQQPQHQQFQPQQPPAPQQSQPPQQLQFQQLPAPQQPPQGFVQPSLFQQQPTQPQFGVQQPYPPTHLTQQPPFAGNSDIVSLFAQPQSQNAPQPMAMAGPWK